MFGIILRMEKMLSEDNRKLILLAEDEEINIMFLQGLLENEPVRLIIANNGKEAVEMCKVHPNIDLILMDVKMPVMNGFEATKLIKEFRPTLPIIIQTAYQSDADKRNAFEVGCSAFIGKPIQKEELLEKVNLLL